MSLSSSASGSGSESVNSPRATGENATNVVPRSATGVEHSDLCLAGEGRIFGLHRRNRMDRAGPAQSVSRHFGQADRADLSFAHQIRHRADRILYRHGEIAPVHIVQVDMVGLKQGERGFEFAADRIGVAIDPALFTGGEDAHLRRKEHLVPAPLERLADLGFVVAQAIEPGGVEMVVAKVDGAMQQRDAFVIARLSAIGPTQRHAAKADGIRS